MKTEAVKFVKVVAQGALIVALGLWAYELSKVGVNKIKGEKAA